MMLLMEISIRREPAPGATQEEADVSGVEKRNFDSPNETRTPDKTKIDVVQLGGSTIARNTFQPGWRWSECIKPMVDTNSCQAHHVGTAISGRLHVLHADGSEAEIGPGDAYVIEPDHDASVVGDEPFVAFEFDSKTAGGFAQS
jgi:hypothetical protein